MDFGFSLKVPWKIEHFMATIVLSAASTHVYWIIKLFWKFSFWENIEYFLEHFDIFLQKFFIWKMFFKVKKFQHFWK
jgi:hypothetical protein